MEIRFAKPVDAKYIEDLQTAMMQTLSVQATVKELDPQKIDIFPGQIEVWFPGSPLAWKP